MRTALLVTLVALAAGGAALAVGQGRASANPLTGIVAVSAGGVHTCALMADGGVKCWGINLEGQLGNSGAGDGSTVPVDAVGLGGPVAAISAGGSHTCALLETGGVQCWGWDGAGQLGDGGGAPCSEEPCMSAAPVNVVGLGGGAVAIEAGRNHTCAVMEGGGVKCWGWNYLGHLGDGTTTWRSTPVDVVGLDEAITSLAAGYGHTCAVTVSGRVECWGSDYNSEIGAESTDLCTDFFTNQDFPCSTTPLEVMELEGGVAAIASDGVHTCAVTVATTLKCWGQNADGELGDGTTIQRPAPVDVCGDVSCTEPMSGIVAVTASFFGHTCALTNSTHVKCWGRNLVGALGDGTVQDRLVPVDVVTGTSGLFTGATGIDVGGAHTCAVTEGGDVSCWGADCCGQLGNGYYDLEPHPVPRPVVTGAQKTLQGDVDCSERVDSIDAVLVLQLSAALLDLLHCPEAADLNDDAAVDSVDASLILQIVAGLL